MGFIHWRFFFLLSLLVSLTLQATSAETDTNGNKGHFSREPYLQLATHESIRIVWRTEGATKPSVRFGPAPDRLYRLVPGMDITIRTSNPKSPAPLHTSVPANEHQYEAFLDALSPATTYYYAIFDEKGNRLTPAETSYRFKTHPVPGTDAPVYFWAVGDSGTGGRAQAQVHSAMVAHNKKKKRELDLYLHVGDMAYRNGTNKEFSHRFFSMYAPTLRQTVCWPSMGNHEGYTSKGASGIGPYYDAYITPTNAEAGGLPSGKEAYYSFDYGKVHFICLDSHDLDRRPAGAMAQWLKADLEKTKADFLVAFFHHPPYTLGSHDSNKEQQLIEMRQHIMPILESGGVDIVFTGHSHIYERSMLMDGAYTTPTTAHGVILDDGDGDPAGDGPYLKSAGLTPHNGTVQAVIGHGGTGVSRRGTMPVMKRIIVENGSVLVSIQGDTLTAEMVNLHGDVRDTFSIIKRGTIQHSPVIEPWQPEPWKKVVKKSPPKAPTKARTLIRKNSQWSYLAGNHPSGEINAWTKPGFALTSWKKGTAGFGYGDKDDVTLLPDMRGKYRVVYIRKDFQAPKDLNSKSLGLNISYDDAFIAYLNGKEILRVGVDHEQGATAEDFTMHEASGKFSWFPIRGIEKVIKPGEINVLAIEGHNANLDSSDFTLHPVLLEQK